jgi:frataxin-like iron-binding protein CyaY
LSIFLLDFVVVVVVVVDDDDDVDVDVDVDENVFTLQWKFLIVQVSSLFPPVEVWLSLLLVFCF